MSRNASLAPWQNHHPISIRKAVPLGMTKYPALARLASHRKTSTTCQQGNNLRGAFAKGESAQHNFQAPHGMQAPRILHRRQHVDALMRTEDLGNLVTRIHSGSSCDEEYPTNGGQVLPPRVACFAVGQDLHVEEH